MILAAVAALVGAAVQSATGFGFALVLSPALFAVLEPSEAVTTSLALGFVHNVLVVFERGRPGHVDWRRLAPVLVAAVPGLAIGVALLALLSKAALQVGVGVAVQDRFARARPLAAAVGGTDAFLPSVYLRRAELARFVGRLAERPVHPSALASLRPCVQGIAAAAWHAASVDSLAKGVDGSAVRLGI